MIWNKRRIAAVAALLYGSASTEAASLKTYIASTGADSSGCDVITSPCLTIAFALARTTSGGIITILDEGAFAGGISIGNTTVTIEGQGPGTIIASGNQTGIKATAPSSRLELRNLSIRADFAALGQGGVDFRGTSLSLTNVLITNQLNASATAVLLVPSVDSFVHLQNVTVENSGQSTAAGGAVVVIPATTGKTHRIDITDSNFSYLSRGIVVVEGGNYYLSIKDTTISQALGDGIVISPNAGTTRLTIKDSQIVNSGGNGLMIAPTGSAKVNTTVTGSVFDGNVIGIRSFPASPATSIVSISDTSASNNAGGVHASGKSTVGIIRGNISGNSSYGIGAANPAVVRVGSSMVNGNTLGLSGPVSSYGNNQLLGNTTQGSSTPVAPAGGP